MKAFITLLGLSFKSLLLNTVNMGRRGKKQAIKTASGIGALVLLSFLMVFLSGTYSFMMAATFSTMGGLDIMLSAMILMATLFPFIFIVYAAQSLVFSTKDVDLILSLPVSFFSVMLARVSALYLEALLMCELMLIPAGIAWLMFGGAGGVGFFILLLVFGAFLALIPTLLSLIFGSIIALVISRLPFKNLMNILLSLLLMVAIFAFSFSSSFSMGNVEALGTAGLDGLRQSLLSIPLLGWAVGGVTGNILQLLLFAAATLLPFLGITWLFSRFYKGMLTRLSSHRLRSDYKLRGVKATGTFSALLKKESRKFFGTPALVLNGGIGLILVIIASVAALFFKTQVQDFLAKLVNEGAGAAIDSMLSPLLLAAMGFLGSMTFYACVSISLEGKTLWILKEAPLSTGKIFAAKAGFNFLLGGITYLICVPLLTIAFSLPLVDAFFILLLGLLYALLISTMGLFINLLLPRMDAENDTLVIKQSASTIVAMLADFLLLAAFIVLYIVIGSSVGFVVYSLISTAIMLALNALFLVLLNTKGRKLFAAL